MNNRWRTILRYRLKRCKRYDYNNKFDLRIIENCLPHYTDQMLIHAELVRGKISNEIKGYLETILEDEAIPSFSIRAIGKIGLETKPLDIGPILTIGEKGYIAPWIGPMNGMIFENKINPLSKKHYASYENLQAGEQINNDTEKYE